MYNIEQTFATKSPLYAQNSNAYGDRMERKLRQRKDKPTWPADMVTFISCLSNGTSLLAVTCPSKHEEGGHFGVLTGMWIFFCTGPPTPESQWSKLGLRSFCLVKSHKTATELSVSAQHQ